MAGREAYKRKEEKIMEVKDYNAIAKIIGGTLIGESKLEPLINTLTRYFESEDDSFQKEQFRSACLNGHYIEEVSVNDTFIVEEEITPTIVQNQANT
tara:strand:- start:317 stop:607 length:291 start_codon:yes stop_codon:yes gene_type:complete